MWQYILEIDTGYEKRVKCYSVNNINDDAANCSVTVHMVNTGIDTGDMIRQKRIEVKKEDNFVAYPYIQVEEGICLEMEILDGFEKTG